MQDLDTTAVQLGDASLSVREFLTWLKLARRLRGTLVDAVVEKLVLGEARQVGLAVTDAELQRTADRFRYANGLTSAEATERWLASQGLSMKDLESGLERDILISKFKDHLFTTGVQEHFQANAERYARAKLSLLAVGSEGQAGELLCQINEEGRDFAELARQHSLHEPSRGVGGQVGVVLRAHLPPAAGELVFKARQGDVVGPVAANQGYHLYRVEELLPPDLESARPLIRQELFDTWLRGRLGGQNLAFPLESALG